MKTSLDCIPCLIRQTLDAARLVSKDDVVQEQILREVLLWTVDLGMDQPAPMMGQRIHRRLREIAGVYDPYREVKDRQNDMAMSFLPELRDRVNSAADPLIMASRLAIAGNVIDMGVTGNVTYSGVLDAIKLAITEPLAGEQRGFREAARGAKRILYLADNAGEIAFDRLLIERLAPERVTLAVRGAPVINDATIADARAVGLLEMVEVVDNGSDAPGTLLDDCTQRFRQLFAQADLIIAKGQGNFETLSDDPHNIFYLFKAKCPIIAERMKVPLGTNVLAKGCSETAILGESTNARI